MFFITTVCVYDFCKTVLVKNAHLARCGLIFPFQILMPYFLHWLFSSTLLTQLKPPEASEQAAKKSRGRCPQAPAGAYVLRTLQTRALKK